MKSLRLSLAHAVPRCTQEAQAAETKRAEEVDAQPSNRQELVFEIVHFTSLPLVLQPSITFLSPSSTLLFFSSSDFVSSSLVRVFKQFTHCSI